MKRRLLGLLAAILVASLAMLTTHVYMLAEDECRDYPCYWETWHPFYWYFECWRPQCQIGTQR